MLESVPALALQAWRTRLSPSMSTRHGCRRCGRRRTNRGDKATHTRSDRQCRLQHALMSYRHARGQAGMHKPLPSSLQRLRAAVYLFVIIKSQYSTVLRGLPPRVKEMTIEFQGRATTRQVCSLTSWSTWKRWISMKGGLRLRPALGHFSSNENLPRKTCDSKRRP